MKIGIECPLQYIYLKVITNYIDQMHLLWNCLFYSWFEFAKKAAAILLHILFMVDTIGDYWFYK